MFKGIVAAPTAVLKPPLVFALSVPEPTAVLPSVVLF
jgi:hypothetical protein